MVPVEVIGYIERTCSSGPFLQIFCFTAQSIVFYDEPAVLFYRWRWYWWIYSASFCCRGPGWIAFMDEVEDESGREKILKPF